MADRTITVERTVEEEEQLTICDDCGREVDEGQLTGKLDFCSECFDRFTEDDGESDYVQLVEEWKQKKDSTGDTIETNIKGFIISNTLVAVMLVVPVFIEGGTVFVLGAGIFWLISLIFASFLVNPEYYPWASEEQ